MAKKKAPTKDSVYEEIRKTGKKGKALTAKSKISHLKQLQKERKIKKVKSKYYAMEIIPTSKEVYKKVEEAEYDGTPLLPIEVNIVKHLISDGKIKKSGKKYYLSEFLPLTQKQVIERLLREGILKRSGKKYIMMKPGGERPSFVKAPSFHEFAETLQGIYLRKASGYRRGVNIHSLVEAMTSEMDISKVLAEKWILELPRVFVGVVDLRPFPGEPGLRLKDGTDVSRIYLERAIVGL
jgi:hypothetical protein